MGAWELPREAPASRKRPLEWYHWEGQAKRRRKIPCCNWKDSICKECEQDCEFVESMSNSLAYKMDPASISTKYLKTTLAPLLKPAVLNPKHHQDNGGNNTCTTNTVPQQQHMQSAWPRQLVDEDSDSYKKKTESFSAPGGLGVKKKLRGGGNQVGYHPRQS